MKICGLTLLLSLSFTIALIAQDDTNFKRYSQENGMPAVTIRNVFEDGQGFLWVATEQGINRFDGYSFKTFRHDPNDPGTIATNKATNFMCDSARNPIFIFDNVFSVYDGRKQVFHNYVLPQLLDENGKCKNVITVKSDYEHNLCWLSSYNQLFKFNPSTGKLESYNYPVPGKQYSTIGIFTDSTLLIATYPANYIYEFNINSKKFREYPVPELHQAFLKGASIFQGPSRPFALDNYTNEKWHLFLGDRFFIFDKKDPYHPKVYFPHHSNIEYDFEKMNVFGDEMWVATNSGKIININPYTGKEKVYEINLNGLLPNNTKSVMDLVRDSDGEIWVSSDGLGLIRINPENDKVTQYINQPQNPNSIWSNSCTVIINHSSGVIWISFVTKGLIKVEKKKKLFRSYIPLNPSAVNNASGKQLSSDVRCALAIDKTHLLVGALSNLSVIDLLTGKIDFARNKGLKEIIPELAKTGYFSALVKDKKGNIIIGTWGSKYYAYNPNTSFFKEYSAATGFTFNSLGHQARALFIDSRERLWFATDSTVAYMDVNSFLNATPESFKYKSFSATQNKTNFINGSPFFCLYEDKNHNIWTGSTKGLYKISPEGVVEKFINDSKNPYSINENDVRHICEDKEGNLWIGTNGGGINKYVPSTKRFTAYTMKNGLPDDAIYTMQFDDEGYLWMSCNRGLAKFNPKTGSVKKFSLYDGLQNYEYNTNAICKMPGGEFVFGGNSGVNVFLPAEIITKNIPPKIALCSFKIFNTEVPLPEEGISVPYNQNNLTIEYAALSFYRNEENQYAYIMERFDKDWIYCNNSNSISYNNLPPGNYTFRVRASNSAGVWNTEGIAYNINILPPWWQTWWARIFFLILIFAIIFFFIQHRTKNLRTQRAVLEQKVEERTEELKQTQSLLVTQEKLASLGVLTAGIAHEIKNPLNFVTNFSDLSGKLIEEYKTTTTEEDREEIMGELTNNLSIINRHSHRANSIVENMLQHSRSGKGEMQPTDINKTCDEYLDLAFQNARSRIPNFNCEIKKNLDPHLPKVKAVPQDISRVMLNFYSNAFDAVKDKGKAIIEVSTALAGKYIEIRIKDNGSGVPENIKAHIFEPFFTTKPSGQGTGLGLSISYDIIKTHGGDIKLESKVNEYTVFIITLPV